MKYGGNHLANPKEYVTSANISCNRYARSFSEYFIFNDERRLDVIYSFAQIRSKGLGNGCPLPGQLLPGVLYHSVLSH